MSQCIGKLFKNSFKSKDNQPDTKGDIQINLDELFGPDEQPPRVFKLEAAGWTSQTKAGDDYQNLKLQLPRQKSATQVRQPPKAEESFQGDADIPF